MTGDPDEMWRPGYEPDDIGPRNDPGPPDVDRFGHVEILLDGPGDTQPSAPPTTSPPRWRRLRTPLSIAMVAVLAALAISATVAIRSGRGPEVADIEPVAGADQRQVPASAARLWSTTIEAVDGIVADQPFRVTQLLIADRTTVVAVLPADDDTSTVVALDVLTGIEQWQHPFEFDADSVNILGIQAGTAIIEQNDLAGRQLIGVDIAHGEVAWVLPTRDNGVHVILSGTDVVTRVSFTGNARLTFIDPATGEELSRVGGRLIGTDLAGTWYVENGRRISGIDLSNGVSATTDIAERSDGWGGPTAIVDGRIIVLDDDGTLAEAPTSDDPLIPLVATGGDLRGIVSLIATGGSSLMAIGDGQVLGIELAGTDAQIRWSTDASVRVVNVTNRGMLVTLSDATSGFADGADLAVVEPVTGERLATAGPAPGIEDLPRIVGNGFVTTNPGQLGFERIGYDLDGTELWRLPGNDPIQFGDRVMVTVNADAAGYTFTGFGDDE